MSSDYTVTRKEAAQILGLSIRSVDRYIRSGKLSSQVVSGRIMLSKSDVLPKKAGVVRSENTKESSQVSTPVQTRQASEIVQSSAGESATRADSPAEILNKQLHSQLEEKQGRLEIASYQLGRLEGQLRSKNLDDDHQKNLEKLLSHLTRQTKYFKIALAILVLILVILLVHL